MWSCDDHTALSCCHRAQRSEDDGKDLLMYEAGKTKSHEGICMHAIASSGDRRPKQARCLRLPLLLASQQVHGLKLRAVGQQQNQLQRMATFWPNISRTARTTACMVHETKNHATHTSSEACFEADTGCPCWHVLAHSAADVSNLTGYQC